MSTAYHSLSSSNFSQDWSDIGTQILAANANDWSGVPSIVGYRGDSLSSASGTDPQTVTADGSATPQSAVLLGSTPSISGAVGVFQSLANPVVALQGSGTADAPHLVLHLDATGRQNLQVSYKLRDLDSNTDNSVQAIALQYRIGDSGPFTNVPAAFVADASDGPDLTKDTVVTASLPAAVNGAAMLQLRVITNDAVLADEWIGIDDILVTSDAAAPAASLAYTGSLNESAAFDGSIDAGDRITITLSGDTFSGADGDSLLGVATLSNVPAGLMAVLVRTSATTAELSFTGTADSHTDASDVNDLAITFADGAFTGGAAASVAQHSKADLQINFSEPGTGTQSFKPNGQGSDPSTAIALDANYMVVGDDEANVLRVYDRKGDDAVKEWSYGAYLGIGSEELDLEGGTRIGDTYYFTGSSGNKKSGADHASRENILAVKISGTGADTVFTAADKFAGLEAALVAWDADDIHGKGADHYGFATLSASGLPPESVSGFSIEGLTAKAGGNTLLLGFRAPQVGAATRDNALVVELGLGAYGALAGASFGAVHELNLGGRGIRSIELAGDGSYLILAGPAGGATAEVTHDFRLFRWDGASATPAEIDVDLDALREATGGSFETIVDVQSTATGTWVQLLQDNGDTIWPGQSAVSKDLPGADQKFVGNWVQIGGVVDHSSGGPVLQATSPADNAGSVAPTANLVLKFDEGVKAGAGSFVIRKASDNSVVETIAAADAARVKYGFNTVTIDPAAVLEGGIGYWVETVGAAITDHYGNAWAGLADATAFNFTTFDAGAAPANLLITEINSNGGPADFFEIYNHGSDPVDLSGWTWNDSKQDAADTATLPGGTVIPPGGRLVVVSDDVLTPQAFRDAWGLDSGVAVVVTAGPGLGAGDGVALLNPAGQLAAALNYSSAAFTAGGTSVPSAVLSDGAAITGSAHAGAAAGGVATVSMVWDGLSVIAPTYTAAVAGQAGAHATVSGDAGVGSPGVAAKPSLLITEINSNAAGGDFFELYNHGTTAIDLTGFKWVDDKAAPTHVDARGFTVGTSLAAGERLIVVTDKTDADIAAFRAAWGGLDAAVKVVAAGAVKGPGLGGSGDAVVVFDAHGSVAAALSYKPAGTTFTASDGTVITPLVRADGLPVASGHAGVAVGAGATVSAVWDGVSTTAPTYKAAVVGESGAIAGTDGTGSPGTAAAAPYVAPDLLITEVNSDAAGGDFFEMYNHGSTAIDLSGWQWTDSANATVASFEPGTTLAAGARLIVLANKASADIPAFRSSWGDLPASVKVVALGGPGLGSNDGVVVLDGAGHVAAAINYGTSAFTQGATSVAPLQATGGTASAGGHAGEALGGTATTSAVWDGVSTSAPRYTAAVAGERGAFAGAGGTGSPGAVAAPLTLLITEINSNAGAVGDFIELYNHGTADIDLTGWKLDDNSANVAEGVLLPPGTILAAGEKLVVLVDKPSTGIADFRAAWGNLPDSVKVVALDGPGLGNNGDAVVLFDASGKAAAFLSYTSTNILASDGTVITPLVRADVQPVATGHAGVAVGAAATTSAVWDGVSVTDPKYTAAVAGVNGAFAGTVGTGSPGLTQASASPPGAAPSYTQAFNDAAGFAEFTKFSKDADVANSWYLSTGQQAAEANGFGDTAPANDWLISKAFNLNATSAEFLSFRSWTNFTDAGLAQPLTLKYSTNFSGTGDPTLATWHDLAFMPSPQGSQAWTDSGPIDLSAISGSNVFFAFQYQSSGTGSNASSSWRVDDFKIESYTGAVLSVAATDAVKAEGHSGSTAYHFTVTRAGDTTGASSVNWAVNGTGASPADAADFAGAVLPSGSVSFAAGETSKTITVNVQGDTAIEQDEGFTLTLSGATGATVIGATAQGGIVSDEPPVTKIHAIQGNSTTALLMGSTVTIEGIVTGYAPGLQGFYLQEEDADRDADAGTSEGIFVYFGSTFTMPGLSAASVGDTVRVKGTVADYSGQTQLALALATHNYTVVSDGTVANLPAPVQIKLPVSSLMDWEAVEGMLVEISSATAGGNLVVTDNYNLGRYGQVTLTSDELQQQFTEHTAPDVAGFAAHNTAVQKDQIILDDASSAQNPASHIGRDGQPLSASNTLRAGDGADSIVGIVDQFIDSAAGPHETSYRVQPVVEAGNFTGAPRPTAADVPASVSGAEIKVGAFNVLNYFSSLGTASFTTPNGTSHAGRGANNATEFARQEAKIVEGILGLNADVVALNEIQNNGYGAGSAIKALVDALNAKAGGAVYDYVKGPFQSGAGGTAPTAGDDAIMVALIYKPAKVALVGGAAVPDASYDAFSATYGSRVPLAQTFQSRADNAEFTVVANHFKSKGSGTAAQGQDSGDGQGNSVLARMKAAEQLDAWLDTKPTGSTDADILLLGDFNSYGKEQPITWLEANGYAKVSQGNSYSFDGLWGSLDHALASSNLAGQVAGSYKWGINAEEPALLDYNTEFKNDAQDAGYFNADAYRSSDHNPLVVGLNLTAPPAPPAPAPPPPAPQPPVPQPPAPPPPAPAPGEPVVVDGGTAGDDTIVLPDAPLTRTVLQGGEDTVTGGTGTDTVVLPATFADVLRLGASLDANGTLVVNTPTGAVTMTGVERVELDGITFAFDVALPGAGQPGSNTGQVLALAYAAFGALPVPAVLGEWVQKADTLGDMGLLAQLLIDTIAPGMSNEDLVAYLFQSLTGQSANAQQIEDLAGLIGPDQTFATQGEFYAAAAGLPINTEPLAQLVGVVVQL